MVIQAPAGDVAAAQEASGRTRARRSRRSPGRRSTGSGHASHRLLAKGKIKPKVVTAVGRELLGFIWAIGVQVEKEQRSVKPGTRAA